MSWTTALHFSVIFILAALLAGFQTSFWFQILGSVTPPLMWLVVFTYIAVYRDGVSVVAQLMALTMMLAAFSIASLKVFYGSLLIYYVFIHLLKSRIFWSGPGYFLMICSIGSVGFHIIFYTLATGMDNTASDPLLLERFTQILLTPAFAFPIYWLMHFIDKLFSKKELDTDFGGTTYD